MKTRGSGILCHITSLPSPYGIGISVPAHMHLQIF